MYRDVQAYLVMFLVFILLSWGVGSSNDAEVFNDRASCLATTPDEDEHRCYNNGYTRFVKSKEFKRSQDEK